MKKLHRLVIVDGNTTHYPQGWKTPTAALKWAADEGANEELSVTLQHRDHRGNWVDGPAD